MMRCLGALLWLVFLFGLFAGTTALAQSTDTLRGVVMEEDSKGELKPLADAHVYWMGTDFGTTTGALGTFTLAATPQTRRLVLRYLGLRPDTLYIQDYKPVRVIMKPYHQLGMVEISEERASTYIRRAEAISTTVITEAELFKAACCNLSESFETNPSVEVSYTDAASGVKQIQLLGLSGTYVQMLRENIPTMRGLSAHYGLSLIPGTWLDEIQLTQGPGSAVNGYEGMSGQINLE
ncbi:MAG: TonB-dependent receptor plug domain-containing protein [Bacteroidota bacterium]